MGCTEFFKEWVAPFYQDPAALASVPYGVVLVRVRDRVVSDWTLPALPFIFPLAARAVGVDELGLAVSLKAAMARLLRKDGHTRGVARKAPNCPLRR